MICVYLYNIHVSLGRSVEARETRSRRTLLEMMTQYCNVLFMAYGMPCSLLLVIIAMPPFTQFNIMDRIWPANQPALQQQFQKENSITTTVIKKCWQKKLIMCEYILRNAFKCTDFLPPSKDNWQIISFNLDWNRNTQKIKCNNVQIWLEFQAPRSRHWGFLLFSAIRGMLYKQILPKKISEIE